MILGCLSALLFVLPAPKILAETKSTIPHCLLPPHSPIRAFTQCNLKYNYYNLVVKLYFSNKKGKRIDRLEVYVLFGDFPFQPIKK